MGEFLSHPQPGGLSAMALPSRPTDGASGRTQVVRFPDEFKKDFWKSIDKRITGIFIVNFLFIYGFLIIAATRPRAAFPDQLDMRLLRKITTVMKVDPKLLDVVEPAAENVDAGTRRVATPVITSWPRHRQVTLANARREAGERFRRASENATNQGVLALAGSIRRSDRYDNYDFSVRSATLADLPDRVSGVVEGLDEGRATMAIFGERTGETRSITDLMKISGGEELSSVRAAISGGGLIGVTKTTVSGRSAEIGSVADFQNVVDQNAAAIVSCYQKQLKKQPDLKGKLSVQIRINPAGLVKGVAVHQNTVSPDVADCVQNKIRGWKFPVRKKGVITVSQTFVFTN